MLKISIILSILIVGFSLGCNDTTTPIYTTGSNIEKTPEEIVIENCAIVQQAAEAFAAENKGQYARLLSDTSLAGNSIIDLLPNGELLLNPHTGLYTEPQSKAGLFALGEIIYWAEICNNFEAGYRIFSYKDDGRLLVALSPFSEGFLNEEFQTACECLNLEYAVKRFAADNAGVFPMDVDSDTNQAGRTLMYYLVNPQENSFTNLLTEPRNGEASSPGEIGYLPVTANNIPVGYYITGYGADSMLKILSDIPEIQF
jgi:hypothetical protein